MNHLALVKTNDQPSFSSVYFSPFAFAEALRASDISRVPSLNLQSNTRGAITKEITSSPYRKFVWASQKKKIKQASRSKTNRLELNTLLGLSKGQKRRFSRNPIPSATPSDLDTDLTVPFVDDSTEEGEHDADCMHCTGRFSEYHNGENWIRCAKHFRWAHTHSVLVCRKILFVRLFRDKHCFVHCLCPLYLHFFLNSVTILCAFYVNYSPTQIRKTFAPN